MGLPARKMDQRYTYRDYRTWPEDERWELIDGTAYLMGAPSVAHQWIVSELIRKIGGFLEGKPCRAYPAPCDVLIPRLMEQSEDDVDTVVQPDVLVLCDKDRIRPGYIWGAPDLVVEILSPSTSRKDLHEKYMLYQRAGVREYWVIDPVGQWLHQYLRGKDGQFTPETLFVTTGVLESTVLEGFRLDVSTLWD